MIARFKKGSRKWSVLGIATIVVLACVALTNARTASLPDEQHARDFVQLLTQGKFAEAVQQFDAKMQKVLPADKLAQKWKEIGALGGAFQRQLGTRTSRYLGSVIIFVTCEFENGPLDVKVVYDRHKRISGLWFVPVPAKMLERYQPKDTKTRAILDSVPSRGSVLVVLGTKGQMTFEGAKTSLSELPALLKQVPNRPQTILAFAVDNRSLPEDDVRRVQGEMGTLSQQLEFKYLSFVGEHPLGSYAISPSRYGERLHTSVTVDIKHSPDNDQLSVQYAVIAICKDAGIPYQWESSARLADPERRHYIKPVHIKKVPLKKALLDVLTPVGLRYNIDDNGLYLYRPAPQDEKGLVPGTTDESFRKAVFENIVVEALIDDTSELWIKSDRIFWKNLTDCAKPGRHDRRNEPTWVNGRPWMPIWAQNEQDRGVDETQPHLLAIGSLDFALEPLGTGRERNARSIEKGSVMRLRRENDALVVFTEHKKPGSRWFRFRLCRTKPAGLDLAIERFRIRPYPEGGLYTVVVSIQNKGLVDSPACGIYFYRNDPERRKPHTHGAGPIKPGDVWNERSMPFALKEGVNEIVVVLDPKDEVLESNENNNEALMRVVFTNSRIESIVLSSEEEPGPADPQSRMKTLFEEAKIYFDRLSEAQHREDWPAVDMWAKRLRDLFRQLGQAIAVDEQRARLKRLGERISAEKEKQLQKLEELKQALEKHAADSEELRELRKLIHELDDLSDDLHDAMRDGKQYLEKAVYPELKKKWQQFLEIVKDNEAP